jgi:hypothetical protein
LKLNSLCRAQNSGVRNVSMNVMSLWTLRTSKIFLPAEPGLLVPGPLLVEVVARLPLRPELAPVPPLLDVPEQLDPELVRVEPAAAGGHRAGVVVGVVDQLGRVEGLLGHHGAVPVRRPPLVHDLGLGLRVEVVRLVPDDAQDVPLPPLERGVFDQEQEDVLLRPVREADDVRPVLEPCGLLMLLQVVGRGGCSRTMYSFALNRAGR